MIVLAIALAAGVLFLLAWLWSLQRAPLVFVPESVAEFRERVSVVIPMYNEEGNVDAILSAMRAQGHANLEVIAVNDRSTDGTAAKLAEWQQRWPELRVVHLDEHPAEWTGKSWPMYHGARVATGEWLIFLDADLTVAPGSISGTAGACARRGWDGLGVLGRMRYSSFLERVTHVNLSTYYLILASETQPALMCGQYMVVRRSVYEAVGGWKMVYDEMQDDVALPRLLSEHGYVPHMRVWLESHEVPAYRGLGELWSAMRRVIAGGTGFSPLYSALPAIAGLGLHLAPWIVVALGIVQRWWERPLPAVCLALAAAIALLSSASYARLAHILGAGRWMWCTRPLGDTLGVGIYLDAAVRAAFGKLEWKGVAFRRRRGFPERPEEIDSVAEFFVAARAGGIQRAWLERMARERAELAFTFDRLDRWSLANHIFYLVQPFTTVRHVFSVAFRHPKELRDRLQQRGITPSFARFQWTIGCGWLLAELATVFPAWLRAAGKSSGVGSAYAQLSAAEQREVHARAFRRLEQQHRPWFQATPPERARAEAIPTSCP
jgi:glycosyltransferase involved in cell wall biosynthesis